MKIEGRWDAKATRDTKGIILKRRDNSVFVRELYSAIVDLVVEKGSAAIPECVKLLQSTIRALYAGQIPLQKLAITKTIKDKYANENLPQVRVAAKMRKRGETVRSNDRVSYVVLVDKNRGAKKSSAAKIGERVDDVEYVSKHPSMSVDYRYYVENQMYQPLKQLLGLMISEQKFDSVVDAEKRVANQKASNASKRAFMSLFDKGGEQKKQRVV